MAADGYEYWSTEYLSADGYEYWSTADGYKYCSTEYLAADGYEYLAVDIFLRVDPDLTVIPSGPTDVVLLYSTHVLCKQYLLYIIQIHNLEGTFVF